MWGVLEMSSGKPRGKAIYLPEDVYRRLEKLEMTGVRHLYEKIERLIDAYEEYRKTLVKQVVCNHLSKYEELYLSRWFKILSEKLGDPSLVPEAIKYLKIVGEDEYGQILAVNKDKCRE